MNSKVLNLESQMHSCDFKIENWFFMLNINDKFKTQQYDSRTSQVLKNSFESQIWLSWYQKYENQNLSFNTR